MGIKERQERDREAVRRAILDAARELFVAEGFQYVSIRKIAEHIENGIRELFAYQNQNARYERHNSHHDCPDSDVKERSDSDKNQIDREQQHSNVFCDHAPVLSRADCL